jgi:uncharacterized protein (TIGR02453 family)
VTFDRRFFDFFNELADNNSREWFTDHKSLYEEVVVTPIQALIEAMGPRLSSISPQLTADPRRNGGSMFRIYRDTRFSKDKTPYKTHAAVQFRHKLGKDVHAPGFYLHVSSREFVIGTGIWRPDSESVAKIRQAIAANPKDWLRARDDKAFRALFQLDGESLVRPPRGFDKDHPLIEDLRRKDFIGMRALAPPDLLRSDLVDELATAYATCKPLMAFLCRALELPF